MGSFQGDSRRLLRLLGELSGGGSYYVSLTLMGAIRPVTLSLVFINGELVDGVVESPEDFRGHPVTWELLKALTHRRDLGFVARVYRGFTPGRG